MRIQSFLLCALLLWVYGNNASAADMTAWDAAYDAANGTRFIPVELWTGAAWDGERVLKMTPAELSFGGQKRIKGPFDYTPPNASAPIPVYERINKTKRQLFTLILRDDQIQGMGRVYDNRYDRFCQDEIKMPLGLWHDHESRAFDVHCGASTRHYVITIEQLDGSCGILLKHCLTFHWLVDGGVGKATDMHYTYAPGESLVREVGNEN